MYFYCIPTHLFSNDSGSTPIHLAAKHGNHSTLKLLLEYAKQRMPDCIDIMDNKKVTNFVLQTSVHNFAYVHFREWCHTKNVTKLSTSD